ncbi:MAG: TonB-dependent receptor [Gemmatimonadota bacterium]
MRRALPFVLTAALASPAAGSAQEPDSARADTTVYLMEPLQVTVERERSAPPPVAATLVAPELLRSSQARNPYQMLRQITGVDVHDQGQGPGFASNIVLRGFTSDHSSDVLLVIDGVPINLPAHGHVEGFADWNLLLPESVSSMRLIHGGASPLYGDFALAGVVEVFTRADADGVEAALGTTSFGDAEGSLILGRRGDDGGVLVGAGLQREEGWRSNADYRLGNGIVRGWRRLGPGRLEGGLSLYGTSWSSPGFVSVPAFNAEDVRGAVDPTDGGRSRRAIVHGRYSRPLGGTRVLQATAWAQASDYELFLHIPGHTNAGGVGALLQSGEFDERLGGGGQVEVGWTGTGGDLVLGVSGRADAVSYQHAATVERVTTLTELDLDATYRTAAAYARWRVLLSERVGLDLGARVDHLAHSSLPRLDPDPVWERSARTVFSPKMGVRVAWRPGLTLKAGSSRGFRSPVGIIGDPDRKPYLAWSHEVGAEYRSPRVDADLSVFRVDVSNERLQDPVTLQITETGGSTRQGIEGRVGIRPWEAALLQVGATWNHARLHGTYVDPHEDHPHGVFDQGGATIATAGDDRVPGVSRYLVATRAELPIVEGLPLQVTWRVVGPHTPVGEAGVETKPYSVLDVGTSWEWRPGVVLDVEVANVADVRYVELRSSGFVTPGTPRSLRAQVRMQSR